MNACIDYSDFNLNLALEDRLSLLVHIRVRLRSHHSTKATSSGLGCPINVGLRFKMIWHQSEFSLVNSSAEDLLIADAHW
jgi:hypothetical protein